MFKVIQSSIYLDVFRLNYGFSDEGMGILEQSHIQNRSIYYEAGRYIYNLVGSLISLTLFNYKELKEKGIFIFVATNNQYNALKPIESNLRHSYIFSKGKKRQGTQKYDLSLAYLISIFYIPLLLYVYVKSSVYERKSIRKCLHNYLISYGYYLVSYRRLKKANPSLLLISNDHVIWSCGIARAAEELDIPVAYMQHASVTSDFPPLTYELALLYGHKALESYKAAGISSNTTVFLVGIPKFDEYAEYENNSSAVRALGICTNRLDPVAEVKELVNAVHEENPEIELNIRPHPSDDRNKEWRKLGRKTHSKFSNPKTEESFQFLKGVDAIIAGTSGIHLEASLMNVVPVFFDFGDFESDRYDFVESGLVVKAQTIEEVVLIIKQLYSEKVNIKSKAKPYCETLGTEYFGKASDLVSKIIKIITDNKTIKNEVNTFGELDKFRVGTP